MDAAATEKVFQEHTCVGAARIRVRLLRCLTWPPRARVSRSFDAVIHFAGLKAVRARAPGAARRAAAAAEASGHATE